MAKNALKMIYTWDNTQRVLEDMAPRMLETYKKLGNTENVTVEVGELEVTLHLPPYWIYIEYGRRAGKFPPLHAIQSWMEVKHIVPRENRTVPQVSYLIARKIAREGTQGKHAVEGTVEEIKNVFFSRLYSAMVQDVKDNIQKIIKNA